MDLRRLMTAIGHHKWIMAAGVVLGVVFGLVSLFRILPASATGGRARIVERAVTQYSGEALLVVDTPGFGIGRADVAMGRRANEVAPVYVQLAVSDEVMRLARRKLGGPVDVAVTSELVPDSSGIKLLGTGDNELRVSKTLDTTARSFMTYLSELQTSNEVPVADRMVIRYVNAPKVTPVKSRRTQLAILAVLLPIMGAVGIALIAENYRTSAVAEIAADTTAKDAYMPPPSYGSVPDTTPSSLAADTEGWARG